MAKPKTARLPKRKHATYATKPTSTGTYAKAKEGGAKGVDKQREA